MCGGFEWPYASIEFNLKDVRKRRRQKQQKTASTSSSAYKLKQMHYSPTAMHSEKAFIIQ